MTDDHERIQELLAGYALRSLGIEDEARADRLLAEHVPSCPTCRATLADLRAVAGELAMSATPAPPTDLLLSRIHRTQDEGRTAGRGIRRTGLLSLAAGVAAIAAMGGLTLSLGGRVSEVEAERGSALEILSLMRSPGASPVDLDPQAGTPAGTRFLEISAPDVRRVYVVSDACPDPAPGYAYQLWLGSQGEFVPVGEMFRPRDGVVVLEFTLDASHHDEVWITEEVAGTRPSKPRTDGGHSWRATL